MSKGTELAVVDQNSVGFTREQQSILADKLDPAHLKTRKQGKDTFTYVEAWRVIERANSIFGFDGWDRETVALEKTVDETYEKEGWNGGSPVEMRRVGYMARVRVTVRAGGKVVVREGTGHGQGAAKDPTAAFEGAVKEAETDAMKRALMTLGDQFGLTLYDKEQRNVSTPDYVVKAGAATVSAEQSSNLRELIEATKTDAEKFLAFFKVGDLEELPAAQYERARSMLAKKYKGAA